MDVYKINEACGNKKIPESRLQYVLQLVYGASRNTEYVNFSRHVILQDYVENQIFFHITGSSFMRKRVEGETPHKGPVSVSVGIITLIPVPGRPLQLYCPSRATTKPI